MKKILLKVGGREGERLKLWLKALGVEYTADEGDAPFDAVIAPSEDKIRIGTELFDLPLSYRELSRALTEKTEKRLLTLDGDNRCAHLGKEEIKLTELEFKLLERIALGGGEFVPKATLLCEVWGEGVDSGIINVYIHYLREKLEKRGEKIIICSRSMGYKIEGRYLGC